MECVPKMVMCPICKEPMECVSPGQLYQCTNEECGWELVWGPGARDDEIILRLETKLEKQEALVDKLLKIIKAKVITEKIHTFYDDDGFEIRARQTEEKCLDCGEPLFCDIENQIVFCNLCDFMEYPEEYEARQIEKQHEDLAQHFFKDLVFTSVIQAEHEHGFWMSPDYTFGIGFTSDLWAWLEEQASIQNVSTWGKYDPIIYYPPRFIEALAAIGVLENRVAISQGVAGGVLFLVGKNFFVALAPYLYE